MATVWQCRLLLEAGADVNKANKDGVTPVGNGAQEGHAQYSHAPEGKCGY